MSTCGSGASRLAMTRLICSLVCLSAMTMMLCVTGSTEMIAVPTVPLLLYWLLLAGAAAVGGVKPPPPKPPKPPKPPPPPPGRALRMEFKRGAQQKNQNAAEIFLETVCFHNLPFL